MTIASVPKVAFFPATRCPEDLPFPACMRSLAEFSGDERFGCFEARPAEKSRTIPCANKFFVGASGIGFSVNWKWDYGGFNVLSLGPGVERHIRRSFAAIGRDVRILVNRGHEAASGFGPDDAGELVVSSDQAGMTAAICRSIDRGNPCIAFGVLPIPEACIVTGYEADGEVLCGWSHFQDLPEFRGDNDRTECGCFRRGDWFTHTVCVAVPGEALRERPSAGAICVSSLAAGLELLGSTGGSFGYTSGLAGYEALIRDLTDDRLFPPDDDGELVRRFGIINSFIGDVAEAKCYNGDYFGSSGRAAELTAAMAGDEASATYVRDRLRRAGGRYMVIHNLMWNAWEALRGDSITEGWPVTDHRPLAAQPVREQLARIFTRTLDLERENQALLSEAMSVIDRGPVPTGRLGPTIVQGVRSVGFGRGASDPEAKTTCIAAVLESILAAIGENGYSYAWIMGVSGAAFRLHWKADGWDAGSISTLHMDDDPMQHIRRVFRATGWEPLILGNANWKPPVSRLAGANPYAGPDYVGTGIDYSHDEDDFARILFDSIAGRGYPVVTIGTMVPPEAGLIHGYDAESNTVIGYHHFRDFPENTRSAGTTRRPDGSFSKQEWFRDTIAIAAFHYKGPTPPVARTLDAALKNAVRTMTAHEDRGYHAGLAAYGAWAGALRGKWGPAVLRDPDQLRVRAMCHNDALACILDGRSAAAKFLEQASAVLADQAPVLSHAADNCRQIVELGWRIIAMQGGFRGDAGVEDRLADPHLRARISDVVEQAAGLEAGTCRLLAPWGEDSSGP